jgi:hypothetical protein
LKAFIGMALKGAAVLGYRKPSLTQPPARPRVKTFGPFLKGDWVANGPPSAIPLLIKTCRKKVGGISVVPLKRFAIGTFFEQPRYPPKSCAT